MERIKGESDKTRKEKERENEGRREQIKRHLVIISITKEEERDQKRNGSGKE